MFNDGTVKHLHQPRIKRNIFEVGDRVVQLIIIPIPLIELVESDELSETERGTGGYGHTGK